MRILWLTWKDRQHPQAGGAEVVNEELAKRLTADGHEVIFIVGGFENAVHEKLVNGYRIVRLGNRYSVYWRAYRYYKKHLEGWADLVIDEVNTVPFFAKFYVKEPNILFVHMLCRQIWFYEMIFPLSLIGYLLEPLYIRLLSNKEAITVSKSTKQDLMRFGFKSKSIHIISEGIQLEPVKSLSKIKKYKQFTVLSLGAVKPMKRTLDIVKAFELLPETTPTKLIIAGDTSGHYGKKIMKYARISSMQNRIEILGKVTLQKKIELMQKAHILAVTSVKEGWGLTVTEAASQGTPAVVYNVAGLKDSVKHNDTGLVCSQNLPTDLAKNIMILLSDTKQYNTLRSKAWQWSKSVTFAKSYRDFKLAIEDL